jgi:hypothetical protein
MTPDLNLSPSGWLEGFRKTWGRWRDNPDSSSDKPKESEEDSNKSDNRDTKEKWWYGTPPALKWPRPEAIRMADMKSADEAPTIEVKIFHNGNIKAARVARVYVEFTLRDAWGDRYHIDVSYQYGAVDVSNEEEWWDWVDEHPERTVKDCNILIPNGGGWPPQASGDTAVAIRGKYIDNLYGQTLYVNGKSDAHDELSTVIHELLHCLGFEHREGGEIAGRVTPMGHYESNSDKYSMRLHPNVRAMEPVVQ